MKKQPIIWLLALFPLFLVFSAVVYMLGMAALEGQERTFLESLEWASETLTTTGYGKDAAWKHPAMILYVIGVQVLGMSMVYLVVPLFLIPMLESRFQTKLPKVLNKEYEGHVVLVGYTLDMQGLIDNLAENNITTVVVEPDEVEARKLHERKRLMIYGELDEETLERAQLCNARALIANRSDDDNAAITLTARRMGFEGDILAIIEEPMHRNPIMLAGADACYLTDHLLGAALAVRASGKLGPRITGNHNLGKGLHLSEVRINPGCRVANQTLAQAEIGKKTGATVLAQWVEGSLHTPPKAEMVLHPKGILVVAGTRKSIQALQAMTSDGEGLPDKGFFLINGHGKVADKLQELLGAVGEEVIRIDDLEDEAEGLLSRERLEKLGVEKAQGVVFALDNDTATLFDTVVLKDYAAQIPICAQSHSPDNVKRLYQAGADFALSDSEVISQVLLRKLLNEENLTIGEGLVVKRFLPGKTAGRDPRGLDIRGRTGCNVVAVERGPRVILHFEPDFQFEADDVMYVCGDQKALHRFEKTYRPEHL